MVLVQLATLPHLQLTGLGAVLPSLLDDLFLEGGEISTGACISLALLEEVWLLHILLVWRQWLRYWHTLYWYHSLIQGTQQHYHHATALIPPHVHVAAFGRYLYMYVHNSALCSRVVLVHLHNVLGLWTRVRHAHATLHKLNNSVCGQKDTKVVHMPHSWVGEAYRMIRSQSRIMPNRKLYCTSKLTEERWCDGVRTSSLANVAERARLHPFFPHTHMFLVNNINLKISSNNDGRNYIFGNGTLRESSVKCALTLHNCNS